MNSPAARSPRASLVQVGGRRPARPPSHLHLHSDCPPESPEDPTDSPSLGQRSVSLTTLQPAVIQPRMAQLETLEAKMASIEVSLSSTPRRKKNGSVGAVSLGSSIRSIPKEIAVKELETLRNALRDKENIIQSLKGQLTIPGIRLSHIRNNNNNNNTNSNKELSEVEKKQAEERLNRLKSDTDNKRLAIKNLKMALERLDITDNIDVRIQQAELEYQLGREELNLLTLLEETRALQLCLEESNRNSSDASTLYSCIKENENVSLHAIGIIYDPKSPRFGAGQKESDPGLWIDWALDDTGLCKGDRLIEVNGKVVLTKTRDDLIRLLAAAPDPAQIVVLRKNSDGSRTTTIVPPSNGSSQEVAALRSELEVVKERAEGAQKAKDGLRSDNIRLTHRISYLEEQVSELLGRKKSDSDVRVLNHNPVITSTVKTNQNVTNINITSQPVSVLQTTTTNSNDLQVFQKGPQVTALVANLPGLEISKDSHTSLPVRSKSSLSNISNTHIPTPTQTTDYHYHKSHRHKHRNGRSSLHNSTQFLEQSDHKLSYRKHPHQPHYPKEKDYSSETNSTIDHISRQNRKNIENGHRNSSVDYNRANSEKDYSSETSIMDQSYKKATKIVQELTKHRESNLYEKHRQKCLTASEKYNTDLLKHYNARKSASVLDFRSEIQAGNKFSETKSTEELDNSTTNTEPSRRLFKKLQESRSVKSLDFDSDCNQKSVDYTSEPLETNRKPIYYGLNGEVIKPRPTPPKKPLRLSLHRAQSLQSVETPQTTPNNSPNKNETRKPMKRNHKGETPVLVTVKIEKRGSEEEKLENQAYLSRENYLHPTKENQVYTNKDNQVFLTKENYKSKDNQLHKSKEKQSPLKWANFSQSKHKTATDLILENGKWC